MNAADTLAALMAFTPTAAEVAEVAADRAAKEAARAAVAAGRPVGDMDAYWAAEMAQAGE